MFFKGDVEPMEIDPPEDENEIIREFESKTFNVFLITNPFVYYRR